MQTKPAPLPVKTIDVSILGASGIVGMSLLQQLDGHPQFNIKQVTGSAQSNGLSISSYVQGRSHSLSRGVSDKTFIPIEELVITPLVFSCLPASIAGPIERKLADQGSIVISNAKSHRTDPNVPIVIPEVNHSLLDSIDLYSSTGTIICNPNCLVSGLSLALAPLLSLNLIQCSVATCQAMSGAGLRGLYAMQMIDNVIPHISGEEKKIETEPLKILKGLGPLPKIFAMVHRVPISQGHTFSCTIQSRQTISSQNLLDNWSSFYKNLRPTPMQVPYPLVIDNQPTSPQPYLHRLNGKGMAITLGNIRQKDPKTISFTGLVHNDIRGAAGNALLIAEYLAAAQGSISI